ncbi:MAG: hypothetical protein JXL80_12375 [Planctomycetes bacterium]|nr:hypothetical protein [Planctomycetota bacterium]
MPAPIIFFLVAVAVVVVIAVFSHLSLKRRQEELQTFAASSGYTFSIDDEMELQGRMGVFALMQKGRSRKLRHELVGDHGDRQVILFEYLYVTGGGKHRHTHHQYCCTWQAPVAVSRLGVRPEGFFDRIGDWFTGRDIDFADDPAFSEAFVVAGDDEAEVRALLTPALRDFMQRSGMECLEMVGDLALLYGRRGGLDSEKCRELLRLSEGLDRVMAGQGA